MIQAKRIWRMLWRKSLHRWLAPILVVIIAGFVFFTVQATYGHPIVAFNRNPVRITFPRAGRVVIWNDVRTTNPIYFARYYFIRGGCQVGVNCSYVDIVNNQTVLTNITVAAGEVIDVKACDCYGGNCGTGGCQYPHVGWKTPHHDYFCPNYFETNGYDPSKGGKDFTALWNAFASSGDTLIAGPQCWGDWDEDNSNGGYDHDFEDFLLIFAYRDTFSGYHDGNSGDVSSSGCTASGWVRQNELTSRDLFVRILSDGNPVASGWANQYRSDLSSVCSGGTCSFSFNLWGLVSSNTWHSVRVQGQNPYTSAWFDLTNTPKNIRCLAAPTVDLVIDGSNGPLIRSSPASYTLSWTSTGIGNTCTASGGWSGSKSSAGSQAVSGVTEGDYTYTITCTNPYGSAVDSVAVNVLSAPTVVVSAPASLTAPASYTATWTSSHAVSCTGSNRFTGLSGLTGSKAEVSLPAGTYDYTVTCTNAAGATASDTKRTIVYAAPVVDLKVDGSDGPDLTVPGPASYTVTWTSANAVQCNGSSRLAGDSGLSGSRTEMNVPSGTAYTYTMVCTNAAGATASDSIRVNVFTPLGGTISAAYARLLFFASNLGQPAQTLTGTVSGGTPAYTTVIHVRAPSGMETSYPQSGSAWELTPLSANNPDFGTTEEGTWTAWGVMTDAAGAVFRTASVHWDVSWYPVHGRP